MATHSSLLFAGYLGRRDVLTAAYNGDNLLTPHKAFLSDVAAALDAGNEGHRTVLNWVTVARARFKRLLGATTPDTLLLHVSLITEVQERLLLAADAAETAGRISSSEASDVLAAFNDNW